MCDARCSWCRNDASVELRRSLCCGGIAPEPNPSGHNPRAMRPLLVAIAVPVALAALIVVLIVSGALPLSSDGNDPDPGSGLARVDRFDGPAAFGLLRMQLALGPRPAGSPPARRLPGRPRSLLPPRRV